MRRYRNLEFPYTCFLCYYSQGIRIPKAFLEALGMIENDIVELSRVDDHIVIKKVKKERNLTLEQIFKDYEGESTVEEFDWGAPVGREVW
ncbi:MAG: AbrB/MazE/SpoVT family DNA-binding domain-containing protein [Schaedlerella sp.]